MKMEPPKINSVQRTRDLLKRLAGLPIEISLPILLKLDYPQLQEICSGIDKELASNKNARSTQKIQELGYFCKDVNFWRDWLLGHGYDLPETLPQIVQALKYANQKFGSGTIWTDLEIMQSLFFQDQTKRNDLIRCFYFLLARALKKDYPGFPPDQITLLALDLEYLRLQIENDHFRREKAIPRLFSILISHIEFEWPEKVSLEDFIQLWVDNDFVENTRVDFFEDRSDVYSRIDELSEKSQISPRVQTFQSDVIEQYLATLSRFVEEGDIINFDSFYEDGEYYESVYYFVGPQKMLTKFIQIYGSDKEEIFFPEEARSFLIEKDITTMLDIRKFYPDLIYFEEVGFIENNEENTFYETSSERKRRLAGSNLQEDNSEEDEDEAD